MHLLTEALLTGRRALGTGERGERVSGGHEACDGSAIISLNLRSWSIKYGNQNKGSFLLILKSDAKFIVILSKSLIPTLSLSNLHFFVYLKGKRK